MQLFGENNAKFELCNKQKEYKGVDFFMRHSIRAEQYFKVPKNEIYNKYIQPDNQIYQMFYPNEKQKWHEEPFLSTLGFKLAFAEALRMKEENVVIHEIYSSPYIRCIQTAIMVALVMDIKLIKIHKPLGEKMNHIKVFNYYKNLNFYKNVQTNTTIYIITVYILFPMALKS